MQENDEYYMRLALEQAQIALRQNWIPVGAVFEKNGAVIAHGRKEGKRHALFDHAEHNGCYGALWSREGPRNLEGVTVFATLEPCLMCMSMLLTTHVSRIVYALEDPYGGGGSLLSQHVPLPPRFDGRRPLLVGGVLREESRGLLRTFFSENRDAHNWSDKNNPLVKLALARA